MDSGLLNYHYPTFTGVLSHGWPQATTMVRDGTGESEVTHEIDAQVRSGDYFVMLATKLDALGREATEYDIRFALEEVASDLIYLQDNYIITKNKSAE